MGLYQFTNTKKTLKADLNNPEYTQRLLHEGAPVQMTPLSNKTIINQCFGSAPCKLNPYACTSKLKIHQYKLKIWYVDKVFNATYR